MTPNQFITDSWYELKEENEQLKKQNAEYIEALRVAKHTLETLIEDAAKYKAVTYTAHGFSLMHSALVDIQNVSK